MQFVPGEGPEPCDLMLVGEGPGIEEDKYGRPFVGKSGRELWRYLWDSCRRTRTSVYITNLVKYRVPDDGDPTPADIARDAGILDKELSHVNPQVVVTLGRWSSRHFLDADVDMETCHGLPHWRGGRVIVPIVHPAAGLHSTEFQGTIAWDFDQLGKLLRGEDVAWEAEDQFTDPVYDEHRIAPSIADLAAVDTEGSVVSPWCLSWSTVYGYGTVWRPGLPRSKTAPTFSGRVVLWHALHDLAVLRAMGVTIDDDQFDDAMIKAYLLCVEPQGLKNAALRHCGMVMDDYADLVRGPNMGLAFDYIEKVREWLNKQLNNESSASSTTSVKTRKRTSVKGGRKSSKTASRGR